MKCEDPTKEEYVWELLEDYGFERDNLDEDVAIFVMPTYGDAVIGVTHDCRHVIYDYEKMIEHLIRWEDMDMDEAIEFIDYNSSYHMTGISEPIIMYPLTYPGE